MQRSPKSRHFTITIYRIPRQHIAVYYEQIWRVRLGLEKRLFLPRSTAAKKHHLMVPISSNTLMLYIFVTHPSIMLSLFGVYWAEPKHVLHFPSCYSYQCQINSLLQRNPHFWIMIKNISLMGAETNFQDLFEMKSSTFILA